MGLKGQEETLEGLWIASNGLILIQLSGFLGCTEKRALSFSFPCGF